MRPLFYLPFYYRGGYYLPRRGFCVDQRLGFFSNRALAAHRSSWFAPVRARGINDISSILYNRLVRRKYDRRVIEATSPN
jgi:hypothetical protein